MTVAAAESGNGRGARLVVAVACVFAFQVALLFWFSDRSPLVVRRPKPAPVVRSADGSLAAMLVEEPTLFVLPRPDSFSGPAWLQIPDREFRARNETEPPRLLRLAQAGELGAEFAKFTRTNAAPRFDVAPAPAPVVAAPPLPSTTPIAHPSTLRIEGDLARRRLLSKFELPSWTSTDLLTNSVVEVLVNAEGYTVASALLSPAGHTNADPYALQLAKAARFEPLPAREPDPAGARQDKLTVGQLIFQWQTLPLTNGTVANTVVP